MVVLKHLKRWSFRDLAREVRGSLVYRQFTRFDGDAVPNSSNLCRAFSAIAPELVSRINQRVVAIARALKVIRGSRLRIDTTVVETNIHYPTDSTLLADGIRVLVRCARRLGSSVADPKRSVKHRLLEINRAASSRNEAGRARLIESYRKLLRIARRVRRAAAKAMKRRSRSRVASRARRKIGRVLPLFDRVIAQTHARLFKGQTRYPEKVLSIFEEHTRALCRGKAHKPTEFGRLVRIDEVENGVVSNFAVKDASDADQPEWLPAIEAHEQTFGSAPDLAVADRGFFSARNEREAEARGVRRVVLPTTGKLSGLRRERQKQRWFRRGLRWRAGVEPRIANLKHRYGMVRATYRGDAGFKRYVGSSIVAANLVAIARVQSRRAFSGSPPTPAPR